MSTTWMDGGYDGDGPYIPSPPFSVAWSYKNYDVLAYGNEEGRLSILKTMESKDAFKISIDDEMESLINFKTWTAHKNAIFDVAWRPDDLWICSASADTTCKLWDVETSQETRHLVSHTASVKSVVFDPSNHNILATGARDNRIIVWDTRCEASVGANGKLGSEPWSMTNQAHGEVIKQSKRRSSAVTGTVTGVVFLNNGHSTIASIGASCSTIKYWDYRNFKKPIGSYSPVQNGKKGFSSIKLNPSGTRLYTCCSNNHIYEFDSNTLLPTNTFTNPTYESNSFYIKIDISVCGNYLASGSKDGDLYIWDTQDPTKQAVLKGHREEVTSVAWSNKELKLASTSDDMTVRMWRPIQSESNRKECSTDPYFGWAEQVTVEAVEPPEIVKRSPIPTTPQAPRPETVVECDSHADKENQATPDASRACTVPQKRGIPQSSGQGPMDHDQANPVTKRSNSLKRSTSILDFFKKVPK